jgi:two-component system cell cycle sensor histidine kinase/response regulator CckA
VLEAGNGKDAVRVFSENSAGIKLIIADMIMPRMHGNEVYEKARMIRPDIKCLFVSGYSIDIIQKRGVLKKGANIIFKPFRPHALLRKIREILDAK